MVGLRSNRLDNEAGAFKECDGQVAKLVTVCMPAGEAIPVEITDGNFGNSVNIYSEVTSVPQSSRVAVVSYTVPVGKMLFIKGVDCSGSNVSQFQVEIDSTVVASRRTYFTELNTFFHFSGLKVSAGSIVKVMVEHERPSSGDYEARIIGDEK